MGESRQGRKHSCRLGVFVPAIKNDPALQRRKCGEIHRYEAAPAAVIHSGFIHQEDTCQALGRPPDEKYQNEGPPPPESRMSREEIRAQYGV